MSRLPSFDFSGLSFHVPVKSAPTIVVAINRIASTFLMNGSIRRLLAEAAVYPAELRAAETSHPLTCGSFVIASEEERQGRTSNSTSSHRRPHTSRGISRPRTRPVWDQ